MTHQVGTVQDKSIYEKMGFSCIYTFLSISLLRILESPPPPVNSDPDHWYSRDLRARSPSGPTGPWRLSRRGGCGVASAPPGT
jgi:hypothetical protein